MKIFEMIINDGDEGVYAISLVDRPAIESNWVHFKDEEPIQFATVDEEQRIILGAVLVPSKPIYRKDEKHGEYYVFTSKDTVRKAGEKFLHDSLNNKATIQHEEEINGLRVVESWFKEGEHDKSMNFGLEVPDGTWMVSYRVDNEVIWNEYVKTGKVKGFSIEGFFSFSTPSEESKPDLIEELEKVLKEEGGC